MKKLNSLILLCSLALSSSLMASGGGEALPGVTMDPLHRTESLQRGAKLFVNYCLGCHSAKYLRYERIAQDLELDLEDVQTNLMFTGEKAGDPLTIAMSKEEAKRWFGAAPPDLSLHAKLKGSDWLYAYLTGFYADESRPYGYNNTVFPSVGMPHVLEDLQRDLSEEDFNSAVYDLTNFMDYMAEPIKKERIILGRWVIAFLFFIMLPAVLWLNHEYWKDVH